MHQPLFVPGLFDSELGGPYWGGKKKKRKEKLARAKAVTLNYEELAQEMRRVRCTGVEKLTLTLDTLLYKTQQSLDLFTHHDF